MREQWANRWAKWPSWGRRAFAVVVALVLLGVLVASEAIQSRFAEYKDHYRTDNPTGVGILGFILGASFRCLGRFLHENSDVLLVMGTALLAYFTFDLWSATQDLASSAAEDARQARELMAAQAATMATQAAAANDGAKAAIASERAFVFLDLRPRRSRIVGERRPLGRSSS